MRLLVIFVVCLVLYDETSASGHTEDFQVAENVTVTLCPDLHLCQNMGCGTSWIKNSVCQCDWACEFFDDCCLDFASVCSIESSEVLDSLTNLQFECISKSVQGTSGSSVTRDFWLVSHCPNATEVSQSYVQIRENCEKTNNTNPLTLIPVTDASNITFRSIYCALCHGRPTSKLVAWRLHASCQNPILQNTSYAVRLRTIWNECNHFLELPAVEVSGPATRRPCIPSLISTSLQHNAHSLLSCQSFTAVVKASVDGSLYRNPACFAACTDSQIYSLDCPTETSQMVYDHAFPEIMDTSMGEGFPIYPQCLGYSISPPTRAPTSRAPFAPASHAQATYAATTRAPASHAQATYAATTRAPASRAQATTTRAPTSHAQATYTATTRASASHAQATYAATTRAPASHVQATYAATTRASASRAQATTARAPASHTQATYVATARASASHAQATYAATTRAPASHAQATYAAMTRAPTTHAPPTRAPAAPPVTWSVILDFNPHVEDHRQCQEGDLFDPFSQTCLSPQCKEGLEYVASEQRCEPVNHPPPISIHKDTFRCLGDSNQGTGIFLMVWTALESTNLTSNSSNTETEYSNKERCIRDLLDVNLTSVSEADHPYSGNSSQFAFNILVDVILEHDHKATTNDTEFENSISRQEAVDSIVVEIENKLEESAKTGVSQCEIQTLQIVQYCSGKQRNPYQATLCSQVAWLSLENETQVKVNNQTVWAFDSSHNAWYRLHEYNLRIQYKKQGSLFKKLSLQIGPCSEAPNNSCPAFIKLNKSQFSLVDEDTDDFKKHENGSLIFLQTGEILEPGEFTRAEDGQISICATKLTQNGTQFFNFNNAQAILSTVGLVISVIAGSVSLVTYLVFPSLHSRTRKAIMGMVTSLIAAQTLLLLSGIAASNDKACMAVAVTGHFLWLASLTWTNVLAFLLWNTFVTKNPSPSRSKIAVTGKVNILSFSYALGVPLTVVIVCLIIHFCSHTNVGSMYDNHSPCWINSGTINLAVFGVPMALFLVINIVLFGQTVWAIRSSHRRATAQFNKGRDSSFLKQRGKELFIYIRMASLMGFTWLFGFSAAFSGEEALWYLFIILNSLQGFFIFLSFTFNGQVKKLWMKKLMSVRRSVLNKTIVLTSSSSKSKTTASSISAGIAVSDSIDMSSNDCTSTANDSGYEASSETSSRFKMALRRLKEKSTQRSEPTTDASPTKPSIPVKEDKSALPFPSDCHASSGYEEMIPGRCLQTGNDKKGFWHKLNFPRSKHTTPSLPTAEHLTKIKEDATSSLADSSDCRASSAYEDVIPGRCLEPKVDNTHDSPTSLKSAEDLRKSNSSESHPHGKGIPPKSALLPPSKPKLPHACLEDDAGKGKKETEKQAPKIPLLPFKPPGQSKTSVPEKSTKCLRPCQNVDEDDQNADEQLPSRHPVNSLEKEYKTEPNFKVKSAILPHVNLKSKTEDAQIKKRSYHNPSNHNPQLIDKKNEDSDRKVLFTKPLPPPRPKPSLQGIQEAAEAEHVSSEAACSSFLKF